MHVERAGPAEAGTKIGYFGPAANSEVNVEQQHTPSQRRIPTFNWIYVVAVLLALATLGCGIYQVVRHNEGWPMVAGGCLGLIAVLAAWPVTMCLYSARCGMKAEREQVISPVLERLDQLSILINMISEQQLLSDRAKAVAFRVKDREALHRAISEEMAKQDWEAAMALADDIERNFGYRGEAARVRQQIDQARQENTRRQINDAMGTIDRHTRAEQWSAALRESERLMQMFPDSEQVRNLPVEIENRRQAHSANSSRAGRTRSRGMTWTAASRSSSSSTPTSPPPRPRACRRRRGACSRRS